MESDIKTPSQVVGILSAHRAFWLLGFLVAHEGNVHTGGIQANPIHHSLSLWWCLCLAKHTEAFNTTLLLQGLAFSLELQQYFSPTTIHLLIKLFRPSPLCMEMYHCKKELCITGTIFIHSSCLWVSRCYLFPKNTCSYITIQNLLQWTTKESVTISVCLGAQRDMGVSLGKIFIPFSMSF